MRVNQLHFYDDAPAGKHIGTEVEVEADLNLPRVPMFMNKADGSLRGNSTEYVSSPLEFGEMKIAFDNLIDTVDKTRPHYNSIRTSVHHHFNVAPLEMSDLMTSIMTYWLLEDPLVRFCGKTRWDNLFALRLGTSEGQAFHFYDSIVKANNNSPFQYYNPDIQKYCALNLCTVPTLGTIEFRAMDGALNKERNTAWLGQLDYIVHGVKKHYKSPAEAFDDFYKIGAEDFAQKHLSSNLLNNLKNFKSSDWVNGMDNNFGLLAHVAYDVKWGEKWKAPLVEQPQPRGRRRPNAAGVLDVWQIGGRVNAIRAGEPQPANAIDDEDAE